MFDVMFEFLSPKVSIGIDQNCFYDMAISLLFVNQNLRTDITEHDFYNFQNRQRRFVIKTGGPVVDIFIYNINISFVYITISLISDIGTEILLLQQNGRNSTQKAPFSIIKIPAKSAQRDLAFQPIKTRFQALFENRYPWIRNYRFGKSLHFWHYIKYENT